MNDEPEIAEITKSLSRHKLKHILNAEYLMNSYDADIIKTYLNKMIDTSNMMILVAETHIGDN